MGEAIAFYTLSAFILGFAILVVTTKDTVHSVLFLVLDFLFVAARAAERVQVLLRREEPVDRGNVDDVSAAARDPFSLSEP